MTELADNIIRVVRLKSRLCNLTAKLKLKPNLSVLITSKQPLCNKHIDKKLIILYINSCNFANLSLLIRKVERPHILIPEGCVFPVVIYHFKQGFAVFNFERLILFVHCFVLWIVEQNVIVNLFKQKLYTLKVVLLLLLIKHLKIIIVADSPIQIVCHHRLNIRNNLAVKLIAIAHKLHMIINKRVDIKRLVHYLLINSRVAQITPSVKIKCLADKTNLSLFNHNFVDKG